MYISKRCEVLSEWLLLNFEYIMINATHRSVFQGSPQSGNVIDRAPYFGNQTLIGNIKTALVQYVVYGLHLLDLDNPGVDRLWSFNQDLPQVVLCPMENLETVQVDETKFKDNCRRDSETKKNLLEKGGRKQVQLSAVASHWSYGDNVLCKKPIFPVTASLGGQMTHGVSETKAWLVDPNQHWSKSFSREIFIFLKIFNRTFQRKIPFFSEMVTMTKIPAPLVLTE